MSAPAPASPRHRPRRRLRIVVPLLLVAAIVAVAVVVLTTGGRDPVVHRYVIPAGTGARLDAGEEVEIVPSRLVVHVGDRLVLRNRDDRQHHMGALVVDADSMLSMTFGVPTTIEGVCTLNQEGAAKIVVKP